MESHFLKLGHNLGISHDIKISEISFRRSLRFAADPMLAIERLERSDEKVLKKMRDLLFPWHEMNTPLPAPKY